jgi:hypothetical protein
MRSGTRQATRHDTTTAQAIGPVRCGTCGGSALDVLPLSTGEAAVFLGTSAATVAHLARMGRLPCRRVNGKLLYDVRDVERVRAERARRPVVRVGRPTLVERLARRVTPRTKSLGGRVTQPRYPRLSAPGRRELRPSGATRTARHGTPR